MRALFALEEAVRKRTSVRNYSDRTVSEDTLSRIQTFISTLKNPFGPKIHFHLLDLAASPGGEKLGTYGVIKGARHYIGTTMTLEPMALEALGYEFEVLVLFLASLDLGTCWLGGTFDRQGFAQAMDLKPADVFPIISPVGYGAEKKHLKELAMRKMIQADQRRPWSELFFDRDFSTPLTESAAGDFAFPLEMLRLAPSASNKQPWRVVRRDGSWHFYEYRTPGYSVAFPYDIQAIDLGIAAAHFQLASQDRDLEGSFSQLQPAITPPPHTLYRFSWIPRDHESN